MGKTLDKGKINRIVVRVTNWIGDAVMNTPALAAIRHTFPNAHIAVLANPLIAELFSPHDWVDEVIVYDKKGRHAGFGGKLKLARELRAQRFDLAILLQNAFDAALVAWLAGIPRRMGNTSDGRGFLLTHGFDHRPLGESLHHVDNYLTMLGAFGITGTERRQLLCVSEEEKGRADQLLKGAGIGPDDFVIGINPGAAYGSAKRWYPERFAEVAGILAQRWQAKLIVLGGPGEVAIAADIEKALGGACLNVAGKTKVRELLPLIKRCNFFITNDSGPMHIAAAFGTPLVAIFGSTDHRTTYPFSDNSVVVRKDTECAPCLLRECPTDHRCMTAVTADDVVAAAEKLRNK
ncbi:lipopolysaccharide heptosyltransferase II [Geomonas sp. RF6]|uniref:lipopolysaccharide heptosyltransferase II n=1 Tax=Geomonas sp. RF6 TaxID=2897342 RepID=UPI001E3B255D|nr:lipopolysaccharide heptosyltransferase II [Geomonas sp. RF6]UFS68638.1 lipopolysaccharide heptosyltransferase II [Geomonas sp. RF6]